MKIFYITKFNKFFLYGVLIVMIPTLLLILIAANLVDFEQPKYQKIEQADSLFTDYHMVDTTMITVKPKKKKTSNVVKKKFDTINTVLKSDTSKIP